MFPWQNCAKNAHVAFFNLTQHWASAKDSERRVLCCSACASTTAFTTQAKNSLFSWGFFSVTSSHKRWAQCESLTKVTVQQRFSVLTDQKKRAAIMVNINDCQPMTDHFDGIDQLVKEAPHTEGAPNFRRVRKFPSNFEFRIILAQKKWKVSSRLFAFWNQRSG